MGQTAEAGERLPEGYYSRAPELDDLPVVLALIAACEEADEGNAEINAGDLRGAWERPRFNLEQDAWLVEAADGAAAAYGDVWPREDYTHIEADGYVHPAHRRRGIGRWLVRVMEGRAREIGHRAAPGATALLRTAVSAGNADASALFESEGFTPGRHYWRMVIDLTAPLPEAAWPRGVSVRAFRPGDEREVHGLVESAFSDNYRHTPVSFDDWRAAMMGRESFDPSTWFLALADGAIIGAALCPEYGEQGWVRQLAVDRPWRGRGVGRALLHHAFRELARRGKTHAGLVVDSYNRSGAQQFYLTAGMSIEREHRQYEKALAS